MSKIKELSDEEDEEIYIEDYDSDEYTLNEFEETVLLEEDDDDLEHENDLENEDNFKEMEDKYLKLQEIHQKMMVAKDYHENDEKVEEFVSKTRSKSPIRFPDETSDENVETVEKVSFTDNCDSKTVSCAKSNAKRRKIYPSKENNKQETVRNNYNSLNWGKKIKTSNIPNPALFKKESYYLPYINPNSTYEQPNNYCNNQKFINKNHNNERFTTSATRTNRVIIEKELPYPFNARLSNEFKDFRCFVKNPDVFHPHDNNNSTITNNNNNVESLLIVSDVMTGRSVVKKRVTL